MSPSRTCLATLVLVTGVSHASEPPGSAELGERLFHDTRLSSDGAVSCATCHDPTRSFTDGLARAVGVDGRDSRRNTPTLLGLAHVDAFPAAARPGEPQRHVRIPRPPVALSLAERCLGPIENPVEMNMPLADAVDAINADDELRGRFAETFGGDDGATVDRLGQALAAFVRTLDPPEDAPYARYLAGDAGALDDRELQGLEIFRDKGRCASCHSGPALSDGRLYPDGMRQALQLRQVLDDSARGAPAQVVRGQLATPNGGRVTGGYGGLRGITQTLPLWDVARTGPYFRDGSVDDLEQAIRIHVRTLRESHDETPIRRMLPIPESLAPIALPDGEHRRPDELADDDVAALIAFLRALSPIQPVGE